MKSMKNDTQAYRLTASGRRLTIVRAETMTDPALMRVLRPLTTPQAAARMHGQYLTGVAVTTSTLGMLWWTTYWQTWTDVMFPRGAQ